MKLTNDGVVPISFIVPRTRPEFFQDDIFPPTLSATVTNDVLLMLCIKSSVMNFSFLLFLICIKQPATDVASWLAGTRAKAVLVNLCPADMTALSVAPKVERSKSKYVLRPLDDDQVQDPTEKLFEKMHALKGKASLEDQAMMTREGVDDSEWD